MSADGNQHQVVGRMDTDLLATKLRIPPQPHRALAEPGSSTPSSMASRTELGWRALAEVRRASEPDLWATLQRELADYLAQSDGPDRDQRLEEALKCYQAALDVWNDPPHANTPKWAQTLHAMAATLRRQARGKRVDNIALRSGSTSSR
jgi:hypothetical protein